MTHRSKNIGHTARQVAPLLAVGVLSLGCGGESPKDLPLENPSGNSSLGLTPNECSNFGIDAPASAFLGAEFSASIVATGPLPSANVLYSWDGEGLGFDARVGAATHVSCAWAGGHALSVTAMSAHCSATKTVQVDCKPRTCVGSVSCPGVELSRIDPLTCPKTNVLVRVASQDQCRARIGRPNESGAWVGGYLMYSRYSADDPRPYFCSYAWDGPPNIQPDESLLSGDWKWDCPRVAAHGSYSRLSSGLSNYGKSQLGDLTWSATAPNGLPVRIAVVDTATPDWQGVDNNPHGKAVGLLALDTACGDTPSCQVQVVSYLGLPLYRENRPLPLKDVLRRDMVDGGSVGTHADLVRAILEASSSASSVRTIVNLSVAYDTDALPNTLLPKEGDFENRVVLDALRIARCRGALMLAAAGNGPIPAAPEETPGFPARWTALQALTPAQCSQRFNITSPPGSVDAAAPLLYAVSAGDFAGQALLTTRGAGQSVLTALGFSVVREDPSGGYTRRLTGTSMSTATVSGIAALLWSYTGGASPDTVIRQLYASGTDTAIEADFRPYFPKGPTEIFAEVRGITRCSLAPNLPTLVSCTLPPTMAGVPEGVVPALAAGSPVQLAEPAGDVVPGLSPYPRPWVAPQPKGDPGCGRCSLKRKSLLAELAFLSSFDLQGAQNMRLLAVGSAAASAARLSVTGGEDSGDPEDGTSVTTVSLIPTPSETPFSVQLDTSTIADATAAELLYQVTVDGEVIDETESVIIEDEPDADAADPL